MSLHLADSARLASQGAPGILLPLPPEYQGYRHVLPQLSAHTCTGGPNSNSHSTRFPNWVLCSPPMFVWTWSVCTYRLLCDLPIHIYNMSPDLLVTSHTCSLFVRGNLVIPLPVLLARNISLLSAAGNKHLPHDVTVPQAVETVLPGNSPWSPLSPLLKS